MQCPECRSETPGSLGRCTRCDAVLPQADDPASWTPEIPGGEPWPPEPWQPEQIPSAPPRQAWRFDPREEQRPQQAPSQERPFQPRPHERPYPQEQQQRPFQQPPPQQQQPPQPQPPRVEQQPWSEQNAWNLPPREQPLPQSQQQRQEWRPEREQWMPDDGPRWRGPVVAGLVAALLTAAIVVGYVFWTKDDGTDGSIAQPQTTTEPTAKDKEKASSDEPKAPAGDSKAQATAFDGLLSDMTDSREKLASITYTCANKNKDISAFETAISERKAQLDDADALAVDALDKGADLKNALKSALEASIKSNEEARTWLKDEDGCGKDAAARLKPFTEKATATKKSFLELWNPIATDEGLDTRKREDI